MIIDLEDYDWWKNNLKIQINNKGYARKKINGKHKLMHRVYMEYKTGQPIPNGLIVHHKNGNRLDNRFRNLEITTYLVNNQNINTLRNARYKPYLRKEKRNNNTYNIWRVDFRIMGRRITCSNKLYDKCIEKRNYIFMFNGLPIPEYIDIHKELKNRLY